MRASKRAFDLVAAGLGVLVTAPVVAVAGALIKLQDGGPVLFRQERVGRGGRTFRIWKLRTMRTDAEDRGGPLTAGRDRRITPVGRWLRRFKLDELPQLLNVLRGEMSLVGPRPEVPRYVARYDEDQARVLELVPGITDPASIRYRNESALLDRVPDPERLYLEEVMPEKIRINLEYAERATPLSDLGVLLHTALALFVPSSTDPPGGGSQRGRTDPDAGESVDRKGSTP